MKIIFICGSLEPGRDGVGDYSFRLAGELINQGQQISLIALNDPYVTQTIEEKQACGKSQVKVLRLPSFLTQKDKFDKGKKFIESINPDWVSLQFVPYSFHRKGLPFRIGNNLKRIGGRYKWHIMFHEGWIIPDKSTSLVKRFVSIIQKRILTNLVNQINPVVTHTSSQSYQQILNNGGITTKILPLFSNIPISKKSVVKIQSEFSELGIDNNARSEWTVLGIFGSIRKNVDLLPLLDEQFRKSKQQGRRLAFFSIGRSGSHDQKVFSDIKKTFGKDIIFHAFGERNAEDISAFLQLLDFGVAAVPSSLVGKSGAYAAMRFHKLEVLAPVELVSVGDTHLDNYTEQLLHTMESSDFSASNIASQLITQLNSEVN